VLHGAQIPHGKGKFWGKGAPIVQYRLSAVTCAKSAELIDLPFRLWTLVGRRKHKFNRIRQVAPMNRLFAAAMRPYVKSL